MIKTTQGITMTNLCKPTLGKLEQAHCSSIVVFDNGDLFSVYFHAIKEAHHDQTLFGTWKYAEEEDWTKPIKILPKTKKYRFEGNPVLWIAPDTKILHLFYITSWGGWSTCILKQRTSTDQGKTWSKSKKVYPTISRIPKNPPIMLESGEYILPSTIEFRECTPQFFLSTDKGKTWKDYGARLVVAKKYWPDIKIKEAENGKSEIMLERQLDQPTIIERKDGSLYCLMRTYRPLGKMFESVSKDKGKTWSEPKPSTLPNPDGGFHMMRIKSGEIVIIYNHSPDVRNPVSVALSEDEGKTWKYRQDLCEWKKKDENTSEETFQYPTITQDKDGMLHAT